jgi:hypothetical protein
MVADLDADPEETVVAPAGDASIVQVVVGG